MSSAPVVVVGAGIAGVACARVLHDGGRPVRVLEREPRTGGRMASPCTGGRPVDTGAAYFTVRDPDFDEQVRSWAERGLTREWADTLAVREADGSWRGAVGPMRWAAPGGLASLVDDLAAGLDVECGHAARGVGPGPTVDGEPAAAAVLAMPDPAAARLLDPTLAAAAVVRERVWEPVLALTAVFEQRRWGRLPAVFVNGHDVLALVADDGDRRGDRSPVLVAHSTSGFAASHLDDPAAATPEMLAALTEVLCPLGWPVAAQVHPWRHARPAAPRDEPFHLAGEGIGLAGDSWGDPRVETAWRSGTLLGRALAERLR